MASYDYQLPFPPSNRFFFWKRIFPMNPHVANRMLVQLARCMYNYQDAKLRWEFIKQRKEGLAFFLGQ